DTDVCEFFNIVETDPDGYFSAGATTVDGNVIDNNWIEYTAPLEGQVLTGNKFWDRLPVLSGYVYEGDVGDESTPLAGVVVSLYGADNPYPDPGTFLISTTTDSAGWYGLQVSPGYRYYHILETDPNGYTSVGATTVGGSVRTENWIEYVVPLSNQTLDGNKFWDRSGVVTPDLEITDIWSEGNAICYQVANGGYAAVPRGHTTALFVDGGYQVTQTVDVDLEPGGRWEGCFGYSWTCSPLTDTVTVWADYGDKVAESDETNNAREEQWACDVIPPEIISGPTALEVTSSTVLIAWVTDEPSDSLVLYGRLAGQYESEAIRTDPVTTHAVTLENLEPATTYHFVVRSSDASGNAGTSRDQSFRTAPLPDSTDPTLSLNDPGPCQGVVTVTVSAADDTGVERVEFYLDGERIFTDYSSPFELPLDTTLYANGEHTLTAVAFDFAGRQATDGLLVDLNNLKDSSYPSISITSPSQGATVSGVTTLAASLADDTGLISARFYVDGSYTAFTGWDVNNPPGTAVVTFTWDTRAQSNGSQHRLGLEVYDIDGKVSVAYVDVVVNNVAPPPPPSPPSLVLVGHRVIRHQNVFTIAVTVRNVGDGEARNVRILDGLRGFQPIQQSDGLADYRSDWNPAGAFGYSDIRSKVTIPAGASQTYTYTAVPVLVYPNPPAPQVGYFVDMYWDSSGASGYHNYVQPPAVKTTGGETIPQAHANALKVADYLIVTNPGRLFQLYSPAHQQGSSASRDKVNALLSAMARLAYHEQGVLGYINAYNAQALRNLIKKGGAWSSKLKSDWVSKGYLLLVGENNVVPAWRRYLGRMYTTRGYHNFIATITDYPYASTYGDELKPELSIGRIIGNDPDALRKPIETSLNVLLGVSGYGFNGLMKFLAFGYPRCLSGGCDNINFQSEVNAVSRVLSGPIVVMNIPAATQYDAKHNVDPVATKHAITTTFFSLSPNRDIIFLAGHGNARGWDVFNTNDFTRQPSPFGSTNPFVFVSSCQTGMYANTFSFAEALLSKGAAAYLGAIEIGACDSNGICPHADRFFQNWKANTPFGLALRNTKRSLGNGFIDRWWAAIYHLFGDPKFGAIGSSGTTDHVVRPMAASTIEVQVPDYEVTHVDGYDYPTIPGGSPALVSDRPVVPVYRVLYDYPAGYQIQDVRLTYRSSPVLTTGLRIPNFSIALPSTPSESRSRLRQAEGSEWWPEQAFEWTTFESPDGTTLALTVYPFAYNSRTTEVRFYKSYSFTVDYTVSDVEVTGLSLGEPVYEPGDKVRADLKLKSTSSEGRDVVVSAVIRDESSSEVVDGLILRSLTDLQGEASFTAQWDSSGFEPGFYSVVVEVKDPQGTLLDRSVETFRLGTVAGEIAALTVTPDLFAVGDPVSITLVFSNTGTVPITGTAVIQVRDETGEAVQEFTHDLTALEPGSTVGFTEVWDTAGVAEGTYGVVGYVLYDGGATDPATASVGTRAYVYLPLVLKEGP
ncbi:MAG: hypothetical protein D6759_07915, partial [Chloroflexi bacterium]